MNVFKLNLFLILLVAMNTTACGKFSSANDPNAMSGGIAQSVKPFGTCDRKAVATFNLCMESVGSDYNEPGYLAILQSSCESTGGTFSANNCDHTGSLGTCIVEPNQTNETRVTYYPPQYSPSSAQTACGTAGGVYQSN